MKNTIKLILILFVLLLVSSCTKNDEIEKPDHSALIENLKAEAITFEQKIAKKLSSKSGSINLGETSESDLEGLTLNSIELIKSYGISEAEIIAEFGSLDNPGIAEAGLAIAQVETQASYGVEMIDAETEMSLFTGDPYDADYGPKSSINYKTQSDVYDCALQALGITAIGELISGGVKNMSKSAVKKVLKKVASKYLGWVGAAIAVYEFGDCMEWW